MFRIGADRYALEARPIVAVLPLLPLKEIPGTPPWVAGLLAYGDDDAVPVIDVSALATGTAAAVRTSTRIVLVDYRRAGTPVGKIGLRLEHVTRTLRCDRAEFIDSGIDTTPADYLGPVRRDQDGIVQLVSAEALLTADVHARLFPRPAS